MFQRGARVDERPRRVTAGGEHGDQHMLAAQCGRSRRSCLLVREAKDAPGMFGRHNARWRRRHQLAIPTVSRLPGDSQRPRHLAERPAGAKSERNLLPGEDL